MQDIPKVGPADPFDTAKPLSLLLVLRLRRVLRVGVAWQLLLCGLIWARSFPMAANPTAATLDPIILGNEATLRAMVIPDGIGSQAWFEWGSSAAYENKTEPVDIGDGNALRTLRARIGGLVLGRTYHCRVVVASSTGTTIGADKLLPFGKVVRSWKSELHGLGKIPSNLGAITGIAGGYDTSLAILANGSVVGWGDTTFGVPTIPPGIGDIVALSEGGSAVHVLALRRDGSVSAWGSDFNQQSTLPADLSDVVAVAAGEEHSLALRGNGTVAAWGGNGSGALNVPNGLSNVVAIAAGQYFSLALRADGTVTNWGGSLPGESRMRGLTNVIAIAAGMTHAIALKDDGTVVEWGTYAYGPFAGLSDGLTLTNAVAISTGAAHSVALRKDGTVLCWGENSMGQLAVPAKLSNVVKIAGGHFHTLALQANQIPEAVSQESVGLLGKQNLISLVATDADGDALGLRVVSVPEGGVLYQCESGNRGTTIDRPQTPVTDPSGRVIFVPTNPGSGFSPSIFHFVANDGVADSAPALVRITVSPSKVVTLQPWYHHPATTLRGVVVPNSLPTQVWFEWGTTTNYGNVTEIGWLEPGKQMVSVQQDVLGLTTGEIHHYRIVSSNAVATSVGNDQSTGIGGRIWIWGNQLPASITSVPSSASNVVALAAGRSHVLALDRDGHVLAWGGSAYGQTTIPRHLSNAVAIACGHDHSLAIQRDGTVVAWGKNHSGQTNVPVGLNNVVAISAGDHHSTAVRSDGSVVGWGKALEGGMTTSSLIQNAFTVASSEGRNVVAQLDGKTIAWGSDNTGQSQVPLRVTNLVAVAAGALASVGIDRDGNLISWGIPWNVPTRISNAVSVAAGNTHGLALRADGSLVSWFDTYFGGTEVVYRIPAGLTNEVVTIAAGYEMSLALQAPDQRQFIRPTLRISFVSDRKATIAWEPALPGWTLQESSLLSPTDWATSHLPNPATVSVEDGGRFYRLIRIAD